MLLRIFPIQLKPLLCHLVHQYLIVLHHIFANLKALALLFNVFTYDGAIASALSSYLYRFLIPYNPFVYTICCP